MRVAILQKGVVIRVIEDDPEDSPTVVFSETAKVGDVYSGGKFIKRRGKT